MCVYYSKEFLTDVPDTYTALFRSLTDRLSQTFFTGDKGFEISDYTKNYKKGTTILTGDSVKFYGSANLTPADPLTGTDTALNMSVNYSKEFLTDVADITTVTAALL